MDDAGQVVDAIRALRGLLSALDAADYALDNLADEDLIAGLAHNSAEVMELLSELETTSAYKTARKDLLRLVED